MEGGKRKLPMETSDELQRYRVRFSKRRQCLFKQCLQLCDLFPGSQVAAVAFSPHVGTPFAFAAPSPSASPVDLFRRLLADLDWLPAPGPLADSEDGHSSVFGDDAAAAAAADGGSGGWYLAGTTAEKRQAHRGFSGLSSPSPTSSFLDDELVETRDDEVEKAEFVAAGGVSDGGFPTGMMMEYGRDHHGFRGLSSSASSSSLSFLDCELTETVDNEEEKAEFAGGGGWGEGSLTWRMVEDGRAHDGSSGLSASASSSSLPEIELTETLGNEEKDELAAAASACPGGGNLKETMMEIGRAHDGFCGLWPFSLNQELMRILENDEEMAELAATLQWLDGVLASGDESRSGDPRPRWPSPPLYSCCSSPSAAGGGGFHGGELQVDSVGAVSDHAAALGTSASPPQ